MRTIEDLREAYEARKQWELDHPWRTFIKKWFWKVPFRVFPEKIVDSCRRLRWFLQRGKRGFSEFDLWGMDEYLATLIRDMLRTYLKVNLGYPLDTDKKSYDERLRRIADAFDEYLTHYDAHAQRVDMMELVTAELPEEEAKARREAFYEKEKSRREAMYSNMQELLSQDLFPTLWD